MLTDEERKEFSIRQDWRGRIILRVHDFSELPHSGLWRDAHPRDLPLFFARLLKGTPQAPK